MGIMSRLGTMTDNLGLPRSVSWHTKVSLIRLTASVQHAVRLQQPSSRTSCWQPIKGHGTVSVFMHPPYLLESILKYFSRTEVSKIHWRIKVE